MFNIKKLCNFENALNSILAISLILNCQSVWQNTIGISFHIHEICFLMIFLWFCNYILQYRIYKQVKRKSLITGLFYFGLITLVCVFSVSEENLIKFLSRFIVFPFVLVVFQSKILPQKKLSVFYHFANWTSLIAWISVFFWTFSTIGIIRETYVLDVNWFSSYASYYNLYFSTPYQLIDWALGIRRNIGIFTEGPMFAYVLIMSLVFILLVKDDYTISKIKIIGIVIALITTASTTGYILFVLIAGMIWINKSKSKKNRIFIAMIALIVAIVLFSVIIGLKSDTASFIARMDDYMAGLKCWLENPILGSGYENYAKIRSYMSYTREWNQGFSNTIFSVLAFGGILFLIPFIAPIVRGGYYALKNNDYKLKILCIVYLGIYFSVISYTFFLNFFLWAYLCAVCSTHRQEVEF